MTYDGGTSEQDDCSSYSLSYSYVLSRDCRATVQYKVYSIWEYLSHSITRVSLLRKNRKKMGWDVDLSTFVFLES